MDGTYTDRLWYCNEHKALHALIAARCDCSGDVLVQDVQLLLEFVHVHARETQKDKKMMQEWLQKSKDEEGKTVMDYVQTLVKDEGTREQIVNILGEYTT